MNYFKDLVWFAGQATFPLGESGWPDGEPGFVVVRRPTAEDVDNAGKWRSEDTAFVIELPRVLTLHSKPYKVKLGRVCFLGCRAWCIGLWGVGVLAHQCVLFRILPSSMCVDVIAAVPRSGG
jgi:hypothetical protein